MICVSCFSLLVLQSLYTPVTINREIKQISFMLNMNINGDRGLEY
jgi:hypothetical protein